MRPAESRPANTRPATVNGIALGPESPLLPKRPGRPPKLGPTEEDDQIALMELLIGPARKGQPRQLGDGMTAKYPELMLIYAVPNGGHRHAAVAAKLKAAGVLASVPDIHLPVQRGPFLTLYVELKRPGNYPTPAQRFMHDQLAQAGHAVFVCYGVEEAAQVILGYLALPKNRLSARPVPHHIVGAFKTIEERLRQWCVECMALLKPERTNRRRS